MKAILILLALIAPQAMAGPGYLVFGDSQSFVVQDTNDARKNWPHILQNATGMHFFNLSRGGRRLSDGHVAEYLRMADVHALNQQAKGIIIALGSLDALFKQDPLPALIDAIAEAQARDMEVICILPPDNNLMALDSTRLAIANICPESITLSIGPDLMVDPVHFGEEGHALYASSVFWNLVIMGKML